jgi:O-antigen/teichoic acid export membrane protein
VAAPIAVAWVAFSLGKPKRTLHRIRGEGAEDSHFSVSLSAIMVYNDIDKTMVARLATLQAAGVYGGQACVDTPVRIASLHSLACL